MCSDRDVQQADRGGPSCRAMTPGPAAPAAVTAAVTAAGQGGRIVGLDILRGMGTCVVILAHLLLVTPDSLLFHCDGLTWRIVYIGNCMLECFFALSGFLIGGALLRYETFDRVSLGNYAVDRATRILPAYYAVFFALTAINRLADGATGTHLSYLLFMQCWFDNLYFVGVAWTLSIEVFSYLLLPVIIRACRFRQPAGQNGYTAIIAVCLVIILAESLLRCLVVLHAPDISMDDAVRKQVHLRLDALLYGLIAACLRQARPAFYRRLARPSVFLAAVCGMLALVEWQYADLFIRQLPGERHRPLHALLDFTLSGVCAAAVIPFCEAVRPARLFRAADRLSAFFQYTAKISYSLYLIHFPLVFAFMRLYADMASQDALTNHLVFCAVAPAYLLVCFFLADGMFTHIEQPAMRLRKKLRIHRHD